MKKTINQTIYELSEADARQFHESGKHGNNYSRDFFDQVPPKASAPQNIRQLTELPESVEEVWEPLHFPDPAKWLILSDVHIPAHSIRPIEEAVNYALSRGFDNVFLNGDILDCHELSKHDKNPSAPRYAAELKMGKQFLQYLRDRFKGRIIYKLGNHEERMYRYLADRAPALLDIPAFSYENQLELDKFGVELIGGKRIIQLGGLCVVHGHEFRGFSGDPVNPARGLYRRAKRSALCGHLHRSGTNTVPDMLGRLTVCWTTGCLCELHPEWLRINEWNHGFATVEVLNGGKYHVDNKQFVKGELI